MSRKKTNMIKDIFIRCAELVYKSIDNISEEQIKRRIAKESRSIYEITAHLIRVNIYFLKRLGYEIRVEAPKDGSIEELNTALRNINVQILEILDNLKDDEELSRKSTVNDAKETENLRQLIPHLSQHYLYHYSQMVYLRRAQDRQWNSPVEEWERVTYVIGDYLNP